ncbi:nucleotidyltransferase domain-containing protein [Methylomonas sp. LL1]|uniref:nucleotidyltransferase family protein n=1 Tax=Methylomonas sp. LL1 TaxID=2785785 RepID=UPI0018C3CD74|nr:nucleotidyltransferase domain-containing protein [Methylomonas sp. LL1]
MIHHPNIPESARQFLEHISTDYVIESLILFGSRAIGDHDERSDVDIAVCGPAISRLEWARLRAAAYKANTLYWVSLVHFDRNPPSLRARIIETGVEIYVQTKTTR